MNKKIILTAACMTVAVAAAIGFKMSGAKTDDTVFAGISDDIEYKADRRDIHRFVEGQGIINPSDKRTVKAGVDGTIDSILVKEGDVVEKGQVLGYIKADSDGSRSNAADKQLAIRKAQRELNELNENKGKLAIYADKSGVITDLNVKAKDSITENQKLCGIQDTENAYAEVYFRKDIFDKINIGDKASVLVTASFMTEEGEVVEKDNTPVQMGGGITGYKVTVKLSDRMGFKEDDTVQVTVNHDDFTAEALGLGRISTPNITDVHSAIGGKAEEIKVKNGEYVNAGDVIMVLNGTDIEERIEELKLTIQKNTEELSSLYEDGDGTIYAPVSGTILNVAVKNEEVVDRSSSIITMADLNDMEVVIPVDELDIMNISIGDEATVRCDVFEGESFAGTVSKISNEGKSSNGITTYDVTVKLSDRGRLMAGMTGDVSITGDESLDTVAVPVEALIKTGSQYFLRVKDEAGNTELRQVEVGLSDKHHAEILSGLSEGETVTYMPAAQGQAMDGMQSNVISIDGGNIDVIGVEYE